MKKYTQEDNHIYCIDLKTNEKRKVESIVNELNMIARHKENYRLIVKAANKEKAEEVYKRCEKVYGTSKDGSMEACLVHNNYYRLLGDLSE